MTRIQFHVEMNDLQSTLHPYVFDDFGGANKDRESNHVNGSQWLEIFTSHLIADI